jgi:orotate phosphoribosyltransferase
MATTPADAAAEITSRILLETKSVPFGPDKPFTFASGRVSPVYVDCRRLIFFPCAGRPLMDLGADRMERVAGHKWVDAVAAGKTAGVLFAAWVAERLALPMLYVRKKPKCVDRNAQIGGEMAEGVGIHWLATWWDALRVAQGLGYLTSKECVEVKILPEDPNGWSARGDSRSNSDS